MGYKRKDRFFGAKDVRVYDRYIVAYYDEAFDGLSGRFGKGSVLLCDKRKQVMGGACYTNELRKITFDLESRTILFEARHLGKKRFEKSVWLKNITNKEFFNYVRNNVEKLFGYLYDVTPNMNRTVFKLKKNDNGFSITKD